eukprot:1142443-Pelagomonas_calceolata.AAC.1
MGAEGPNNISSFGQQNDLFSNLPLVHQLGAEKKIWCKAVPEVGAMERVLRGGVSQHKSA